MEQNIQTQMNNECNLQELVISRQDFEASGWKEVITPVLGEGYIKMGMELSHAAVNAFEEGRVEHGKVLRLLADACSMTFSLSNTNEPISPYPIYTGSQSITPVDLLKSNIMFFAEIIDAVDDNWLKARLSDLLWLESEPRNPAFAVKAIDAYRSIPLDKDIPVNDGLECWTRAIYLAQILKKGAGDRLQKMETTINEAFNAAQAADGFLRLWLADLFKSCGLGKTYRSDVAIKLETLAREFDDNGNFLEAQEYFTGAAEWYKDIPNAVKSAEMTYAIAESLIKEAAAKTSTINPSHMGALRCYDIAIKRLRTIPKSERDALGVDERMKMLRTLQNDSGKRAIEEMKLIETSSTDISPLIEKARKTVTGKSVKDALLAFASVYGGANAEYFRNSALRNKNQHPLLSMFEGSMMSCDGRITAKHPALSFSTELTDTDEIAIRAGMIREHGIMVQVVVQGSILPALEVLLHEHQIQEADFISLARNSSYLPQDRAGLFGKALFAGYKQDFVTALHLLVPQIENLVRVHLKQAGAVTSNLDKDGIQNENGLSTLLKLPEAEKVFGPNLTFELNALFCDGFGPNLRNELAHGLLDENKCNSPFSIYAWWLSLNLTFKQ